MKSTYLTFRANVINWYKKNKRDLPWRETSNPYFIWLSEIILQQTRVNQGMPYYYKFIEAFPTINDLADASEQEVLRLWQGLGYYSRARNLHKCAKLIQSEFNSEFPDQYQEILKLPGIGPYTAAAISSIAFNTPKPAVDGNVLRVITRHFGIEEDIANPKTVKKIYEFSEKLIDKNDPASYNQAIMEFGALQCTPKAPKCHMCPLAVSCAAFKENKTDVLPLKLKKIKKRNRHFHYIIFRYQNELGMKLRSAGDIWQGLYDFFLIEDTKQLDPDQLFDKLDDITHRNVVMSTSKSIKHVLTHQNIYAHFVIVHVDSAFKNALKDKGLAFYSLEKVQELPKPILINNYLHEEIF